MNLLGHNVLRARSQGYRHSHHIRTYMESPRKPGHRAADAHSKATSPYGDTKQISEEIITDVIQ